MFVAWHLEMLNGLCSSSESRVAEIAAKAVKEVQYHVERSGETVIGLGDGTDESHARIQAALDHMWPYVGEMFTPDAVDEEMMSKGVIPDLAALRSTFDARVGAVMAEATLTIPARILVTKAAKAAFSTRNILGIS